MSMFDKLLSLIGFEEQKPKEKTPEEVEQERKEYDEFLLKTLKAIGEKDKKTL